MKQLLFLAILLITTAPAEAQFNGAEPDLDELMEMLYQVPDTPPVSTPTPLNSPGLDSDFNIDANMLESLLSSGGVMGGQQNSIAPGTDIVISPSYPQPGQMVTVTLRDYTADLRGAKIRWVIDGREIPSAANQREVTFKAPASGETQTIQAILETVTGELVAFSKTVQPRYVDIIVEPQTRVPDNYLGRALPSYGSTVNVTALIHNVDIEPQNLVYAWEAGGEVIEGGPIRGRQQTSFTVPRGDDVRVIVRISNLNGEILGTQAVTIPSVRPQVYFYDANPLFGVNELAINDAYNFVGNSATLRAEPYNLDTQVYNSPDLIEWEVDRQPIEIKRGNPYEIAIQRMGSGGYSKINFHVRSLDRVLQGTEDAIRVNY